MQSGAPQPWAPSSLPGAAPDAATWRTLQFGAPGSLDYRMLLLDSRRPGSTLSFWHDVPLHATDGNVNFICLTPRGQWAKYEVAKDERSNPIRLPRTSDSPAHFAENAPWTCGVLPQTLADFEGPSGDGAEGGLPFDRCPIEVIDISGQSTGTGRVYQVKPLGGFLVVDRDQRMAWKLVAVAASSPLAHTLEDVADVDEHMPATMAAVREWLRTSRCTRPGDTPLRFALGGEAAPAPAREAIWQIALAHSAWQLLREEDPALLAAGEPVEVEVPPGGPPPLLEWALRTFWWQEYSRHEVDGDAQIPLADSRLGSSVKYELAWASGGDPAEEAGGSTAASHGGGPQESEGGAAQRHRGADPSQSSCGGGGGGGGGASSVVRSPSCSRLLSFFKTDAVLSRSTTEPGPAQQGGGGAAAAGGVRWHADDICLVDRNNAGAAEAALSRSATSRRRQSWLGSGRANQQQGPASPPTPPQSHTGAAPSLSPLSLLSLLHSPPAAAVSAAARRPGPASTRRGKILGGCGGGSSQRVGSFDIGRLRLDLANRSVRSGGSRSCEVLPCWDSPAGTPQSRMEAADSPWGWDEAGGDGSGSSPPSTASPLSSTRDCQQAAGDAGWRRHTLWSVRSKTAPWSPLPQPPTRKASFPTPVALDGRRSGCPPHPATTPPSASEFGPASAPSSSSSFHLATAAHPSAACGAHRADAHGGAPKATPGGAAAFLGRISSMPAILQVASGS